MASRNDRETDSARTARVPNCVWRVLIAAAFTLLALVEIGGSHTPDFAQDYAAAWAYWNGQDVHANTGELLEQCWPDHGFTPGKVSNLQQPHPPLATWLTLPLACLSFPAARIVWCVIAGLAVGSAWQFGRIKPSVCLATAPIWCVAFVLGTHEPLLFWLIVVAVRLLAEDRRNSNVAAGVALGLAVAIKVYPIVLLLGLLATRRYRALVIAVATALLAAAVAEMTFGIGTTAEWLAYSRTNTLSYVSDVQNHSLVKLGYMPLEHIAFVSPFVVSLVLLAILSWPIVRKLRSDDPLTPLVPVMLLASPLSWRHYMGLSGVLPLRLWEQALVVLGGTLTLLYGMQWIAAPPELLVQIPLVAVLVSQLIRSILAKPTQSNDC